MEKRQNRAELGGLEMLGECDLQYSAEWLSRIYGEVTLEQYPGGRKEVSHADIKMWNVPGRGSCQCKSLICSESSKEPRVAIAK